MQGTTNQAIRGGQTSCLLGDATKDNTNYNQQSDMRQEDFKKAAEEYDDSPDAVQRIIARTGIEFGAEHGYQYAIDKACEWLSIIDVNEYLKYVPGFGYVIEDEDAIKAFRKAMEE